MFLVPPPGLMKPKIIVEPAVFVAAASAGNSSGSSSITVSKPTGTQEDDLLVFFWFGQGGSAAQIISRPSGWANKYSATDPNQDGTAAFFDCDTLIAGAAEPASYTWTLSGGGEEGLGAILAYRPAHATQLDVITGADLNGGAAGASFQAPNVTTNQDQARMVSMWALNGQGTNPPGGATPAGMTQRVLINSGIGRNDLEMLIAEDNTLQSPAGLYTGQTLLTSNTSFAHGITLGIRALGT